MNFGQQSIAFRPTVTLHGLGGGGKETVRPGNIISSGGNFAFSEITGPAGGKMWKVVPLCADSPLPPIRKEAVTRKARQEVDPGSLGRIPIRGWESSK